MFRLDQVLLDRCYRYLKPKRRPRSVDELRAQLSNEGCCVFTDAELRGFLKADSRFIVGEGGWSTVRVRRNRDGGSR